MTSGDAGCAGLGGAACVGWDGIGHAVGEWGIWEYLGLVVHWVRELELPFVGCFVLGDEGEQGPAVPGFLRMSSLGCRVLGVGCVCRELDAALPLVLSVAWLGFVGCYLIGAEA